MITSRRSFVATAGFALAGLALPRLTGAVGAASQVDLVQLIYPGGNWEPRPTALRRLAWEIHKRTAIDTALEPSKRKVDGAHLAMSPFAYISGDRSFPAWEEGAVRALDRFLRVGGTLVVDPAYTPDGDPKGFDASVDALLESVMPDEHPQRISPGHLLYRTFYDLSSPSGRVTGSGWLNGYALGERIAVFRGDHDMGGAWARDNLGNWEHEVDGGERQRENAFRLGINLVMYSLCLGYKNEEPHRRFGAKGSPK